MHLSSILGRTYKETVVAYIILVNLLTRKILQNHLLMGELHKKMLIIQTKRNCFSSILRQRIGHHIIGENWANTIKTLEDNKLLDRPIHIISANMHSVSNMILHLTP